jgi:hypothetical protein
MKTASKGQAVKEFPRPAYVNREEVPQPEPTMQETHEATREPSPTRVESPRQKPTPTRIKPKWTRRPFPTATETQRSGGPGSGNKTPPRWRRTPSGTPTGGDG